MSKTLHSTEHISKLPPKIDGGFIPLDENQINSLITSRKQALEQIKDRVSRKVYFLIEEKITHEQARLKEILDWQQGRQSALAKYSLILDPHYFEQEFLN